MTPAERFPVGGFIVEEMAARGWSMLDLSSRSGLTEERLEDILVGSPVTAVESTMLGTAFGVSGELFSNLQST